MKKEYISPILEQTILKPVGFIMQVVSPRIPPTTDEPSDPWGGAPGKVF